MKKKQKYLVILIVIISCLILFYQVENQPLSEEDAIKIIKDYIEETNVERGNTTPINWDGYSFIITKKEDGSYVINMRSYTEEKKAGTSGNLGWYYISKKGDIEVK